MWQLLRNNPLALLLAILFHIGLIAFLIVGIDWKQKPAVQRGDGPVIQARIVEPAQPRKAERERQHALAARKQRQADAERKHRLEAEKKRKAEAERKRRLEAEKKRRAEAERKRRLEAEKKRRAEAERKRKLEAEKKRRAEAERKRRLEAEKKRRAEAERKRRLEAEKKRRAEAERKRKLEAEKKRKAEAERKRRLEAEKKRKAEAARRAAEERAMQQALEAEIAGELNARELNRYIGLIQKRITRSWIRPPDSLRGLRCTVRVRLVGNGTIVPGSVRIVHGSGNGAFDRSVVQAVYKAEPLPVPQDPVLRARFNELELIFDPDK